MAIAPVASWALLVVAAAGPAQLPSDNRPDQAVASPLEDDPALLRRYLDALEKNPRRGSALDRVYGLNVERGKINELIDGYRSRTEKSPDDAVAWMVLGLLEAHRGRDGAAVPAFRRAEVLRPRDPLASFYLGQALVLTGQPGPAVEAFERAIARKPASRSDLLEVYQALGRVHQREQRIDQALAVWKRLEDQFPTDVRVRERVAAALVEDNQLGPALERYQRLAANGEDRLRQPIHRATAAELKSRLGRRDEALADLEQLLDDLPPGEWLERDARRRLEELFLHRDDVAGLVAFYEKRLIRQPGDLGSIVRLAHYLQTLDRKPDALRKLEDALKIAPTDPRIRLELATLLAEQRDFAAAAAQYEAIHRLDPANADVVREWGWLTL
jgi:tetratricopeptide (TPR) repeat protein